MQIDHILAFNAALLIALISPGPAFLLVLRTGGELRKISWSGPRGGSRRCRRFLDAGGTGGVRGCFPAISMSL